MSDEEASSSLIDPRDDHIAAIRELQLIVQDLQIQNEQLSEQLYVLERFQIDAEQRPRANMNQPRFYAILRGHFDHENNTFTRGIYDDPDEVALLTRGAWRAMHIRFHSREEAQQHCDENIDAVLLEDAQFFSPTGEFSQRWYAVWTVNPPWHAIVSTSDEADTNFSGRPGCQRRAFPTYTAAAHYMESIFVEDDSLPNDD